MTSLDTCLREAARDQHVALGDAVEPFAGLPYELELAVKRAGLAAFLAAIDVAPERTDDLVPAPLPRGYRTTSRRRAEFPRGGARLVHGGGGEVRRAGGREARHGSRAEVSRGSPLEPALHAAVYATIERLLGAMTPALAHAVNHVILRGTYEELVLILNVRDLDARIVRSLRTLAERVAEAHTAVRHAWIYHDPKGSRYYLELERPASGVGAKKLFGAAAWKQTVGEVNHQVGVFSFSQVNLAMVPALIGAVKRHARAKPADVLYDLYCGYGLFGAAFARDVAAIVAVDADEATVDNARYVVQRAGGQVLALRQLLRGGDDVAAIARAVGQLTRRDVAADRNVVLLDPPRAGTPAGMIAAVAKWLQPRRVVEVFCGPDEIARSTREWKASGYALDRVTPLDLFPGTTGLEVVVSYVPGAAPETA